MMRIGLNKERKYGFIIFRTKFYRAMRVRYIIFYTATIACTLMFMYYIMAFCAVYPKTSIAWIFQFINNLFMSWFVFQFVGPVSGGVVRKIVRKFPKQV
jgi:hypothetical protein